MPQLPEVIATLRSLMETVPRPARLPTEAEVTAAEVALGVRFPADYRYFALHASDVTYGVMEPACIAPDGGDVELVRVATRAWEAGVPREFLPFCEDNGDYYCLESDGGVALLSHDGMRGGTWPDLAHWIQEVWIDEFQDMQRQHPPE